MSLATLFGDIADAIRAKNLSTGKIVAGIFPNAILALPEINTADGNPYSGPDGLRELFADIAAAIRTQDGTADPIAANDFPSRIRDLVFYKEQTVTFTSSLGWTVPVGVTSVTVKAVGGGGGGGGKGGNYNGGQYYIGGYGGGGECGTVVCKTFAVTERETILISIGRGGSRGSNGTNSSYSPSNGGFGGDGTLTAFGKYLSASGGSGGTPGRAAASYGPGYPLDIQNGKVSEFPGGYGDGGDSGQYGRGGAVMITYTVRV